MLQTFLVREPGYFPGPSLYALCLFVVVVLSWMAVQQHGDAAIAAPVPGADTSVMP